tara:strand:- start:45 stop:476 length:432 start_codon:yes stop_codon:yes gene_type:complete
MKLATISTKAKIWNIFKNYKKIFPHIRNDYLQRQIKSKNVIFDKGVVLINSTYQRKVSLGNKQFEKGTNIIHQIVNSKQGNGNATKVLKQYFKSLPNNTRCILTVRKSNKTAGKFYERNNFNVVGKINWSNNTIKGLIYERVI